MGHGASIPAGAAGIEAFCFRAILGGREGQACVQCHSALNVALVEEWRLGAQLLEKYMFVQPGHKWLKEGMTKEQLQKIREYSGERYGEQRERPWRA